jgi:hypothetical protein
MRENVKELVRHFAATFEIPEPIVEVGSYQVKADSLKENLRPYFPDRRFIGVDMRAGPGVDQVEDMEKKTQL